MGQAAKKPSAHRGRVLVIEDDDAARFGLVAALRARGYELVEAATCSEARRLLAVRPDVVITDLRLPDGDAVELLPQIHAVDPSIAVYVLTGFASVEAAVRAVKLGAEDFFTKPVELATLLVCIEQALERRMARTTTGKRPRVRLEEDAFRPRSDAMKQLEEEVERLRGSDCTVLVLGETGTGKSVIARRIHELSGRRGGPFVDINCAGLSRDFVESELFGHERGAFTGAHAPKQGLFDAAHGGTLFLDEIGDIDVQVQPKVLKVLEERRFRRMGDVRERNSDVRLIAATHHDLLVAVGRKTFRADLFYRISTVTLMMPALRERRGDIVPLTQQILSQEGAAEVGITVGAWEKLATHGWPGNIRELKNVIQRALLLRKSDAITADNIRFDSDTRPSGQLRAVVPEPLEMPIAEPARRRPSILPGSTLEEMERSHIRSALKAERGRVREAARRLGIPRSTLYLKIKQHGIALPFRPDSSVPPGETGDEKA